jgi:hypothetical protein
MHEELKAVGWGFSGQADEHHSRKQRLTETWAKGQQIIVCRWRQDGTDVVTQPRIDEIVKRAQKYMTIGSSVTQITVIEVK